jgi:hypothetical protein
MSKEVVRAGYDAIAAEYTAARHVESNQLSLLQDLAGRLPSGARVLDAGCGAGMLVTRWISDRSTATGVDISEEQIRLARQRKVTREYLGSLSFGSTSGVLSSATSHQKVSSACRSFASTASSSLFNRELCSTAPVTCIIRQHTRRRHARACTSPALHKKPILHSNSGGDRGRQSEQKTLGAG